MEDASFLLMLILNGILAAVFYPVGEKRNIGGTWAAICVFFLGILGMIIVFCSEKIDDGNDGDITFVDVTDESRLKK